MADPENTPPEAATEAATPDAATTDAIKTETISTDVHSSPLNSADEQRREPRFHVHWHVVTELDKHGICHGFIKEISIQGATLFLDHDLIKVKTILLEIESPALQPQAPPHILAIDCHVIYAIHDSEERMFRTGIHFHKFRIDSDKDFLDHRLRNFEVAVR
jgi:hypothetical protein